MRTRLQSGNVVLESGLEPERVMRTLERGLVISCREIYAWHPGGVHASKKLLELAEL